MQLRIVTTLFCLLGLACSDPTGPSLSVSEDLVLQILSDHEVPALPDDDAVITSASVVGRTLHLRLRFGGGCAPHAFAVVAGSSFGDSAPPFTLLRLVHEANGDMCEALLERDLRVDLSPIVPLVQQGGGTALRFELLEPGERPSSVGELLLTF